ncbi:MAG TPA: hypothetical protein PKA63_11335 [Oligoflexia bacterium]|nr:hypothetical protein [Oligoflexia bacterium]HMP49251.1 hypothetical protein [Oligoflexia bacterium]
MEISLLLESAISFGNLFSDPVFLLEFAVMCLAGAKVLVLGGQYLAGSALFGPDIEFSSLDNIAFRGKVREGRFSRRRAGVFYANKRCARIISAGGKSAGTAIPAKRKARVLSSGPVVYLEA